MMTPQDVLQTGTQRTIAPRTHPYSPYVLVPLLEVKGREGLLGWSIYIRGGNMGFVSFLFLKYQFKKNISSHPLFTGTYSAVIIMKGWRANSVVEHLPSILQSPGFSPQYPKNQGVCQV